MAAGTQPDKGLEVRISSIRALPLVARGTRPIRWATGTASERGVTVVRVESTSGHVGWGETLFPDSAEFVSRHLAPMLLGVDALERTRVWLKMEGAARGARVPPHVSYGAVSAVDMAMWDLCGRALGVPVHTLLGGAVRRDVEVYASGLYYSGERAAPDAAATEAEAYVGQGFRAVKMKIGGEAIASDIARVRAVRETVGPHIRLMADANQRYDLPEAISVGEQLAECGVSWFEEPLPARDHQAYASLASAVTVRIAAGESLFGTADFLPFLATGALRVVQPSVARMGGLTEAARLAAVAAEYPVQVAAHAWGSQISLAASLHYCATLRSGTLHESGEAGEAGEREPILELDCTPNPIRDQICRRPLHAVDGRLAVPQTPGLGIEVDEAAVERMCEFGPRV